MNGTRYSWRYGYGWSVGSFFTSLLTCFDLIKSELGG